MMTGKVDLIYKHKNMRTLSLIINSYACYMYLEKHQRTRLITVRKFVKNPIEETANIYTKDVCDSGMMQRSQYYTL